jgi:hypothetical protein
VSAHPEYLPVRSKHRCGFEAAWFETRGVAALLTMRVSNLDLRSVAERCVSKDEAPHWETR